MVAHSFHLSTWQQHSFYGNLIIFAFFVFNHIIHYNYFAYLILAHSAHKALTLAKKIISFTKSATGTEVQNLLYTEGSEPHYQNFVMHLIFRVAIYPHN